MKSRIVIPAIASLALFATAAFAQDGPPPPDQGKMGWHHRDKADMQKHFAQMCQNGYAKAVGGLAYLEVRLDLTDTQKPLFERWKNTMLSIVRERTDKCSTMKMPDHRPSLADHMKRQEERLEMRLADLKKQEPAFDALAATLTPEQQKIMAEAHRHLMMARGEMRDRMRDHGRDHDHMHGHMMGDFHRDGPAPDGDNPPPPAQ